MAWLGHCDCGWFSRRVPTELAAWCWVLLHVCREHDDSAQERIEVARPWDA